MEILDYQLFHVFGYGISVMQLGFVSLIGAFFSYKARQLLVYGLSQVMFIFVRRTYLHRSLGNVFIADLTKKGYKNKKFSGELYGEDPAFIRSEQEVKHILYRDFTSNVQLFYGKGWPILISGTPLVQKGNVAKNFAYCLYTFRWTVDLVEKLNAATETKNESDDADIQPNRFVVKKVSGGRFLKEKESSADPEGNRKLNNAVMVTERELANPFSSFIPVKWEKNNIGETIYHNTLEQMSLNQEQEKLIEEIQFWFKSQEWYEERGIPWKRGYLFYGNPGTGKTLLTRAIAEKLNTTLCVFDLASMNNMEFAYAWNQLLPKRIALFEDFDTVFNGRNAVQNNELSFEAILNAIDGADKKQGILTIITTNHPETLDYALGGPNGSDKNQIVSRPGRIDKAIEFLPLDYAGRMKVAMRIVKDKEMADKLVKLGENDSAAQLQERCFRAAVERLFIEKKEEPSTTNGVIKDPVDYGSL